MTTQTVNQSEFYDLTFIRDFRKEYKISIEDIADLLDVSTGQLYRIERGERLMNDLEANHEFYLRATDVLYQYVNSDDYTYTHPTELQIEQAIELCKQGLNIVKVGLKLEVCDGALSKMLDERGIEYEEFVVVY